MRYRRKDSDAEAIFWKGATMHFIHAMPEWFKKFTELTPAGLRVVSGNGQVMVATLPCFVVLEKGKRGAYIMATKDFSEEFEDVSDDR